MQITLSGVKMVSGNYWPAIRIFIFSFYIYSGYGV